MAEPWLIALLTAGAAALWIERLHPRRTALVVVLVVTTYFGVKATLYAHVRRVADTEDRLWPGSPRAFEARWGSWTKWYAFEKAGNELRTWQLDGWTDKRELLLAWPVQPEGHITASSRTLDTVRNFLAVHDLTFATDRADSNGSHAVLWSDIRYCWQTVPEPAKVDCALWFGGTFDAEGHALRQVVLVGRLTQRRSVSP
jgi:hypothetical protein